MDNLIIKAKSLDEAITKAMLDLNTTSDNLEYNVIKEDAGFLGLGKTYEVEFWIKGSKPQSESSFSKSDNNKDTEVYEFKSEKAASASNSVGSTSENLDSKQEFLAGLEKSLSATNIIDKDVVNRDHKPHRKKDTFPKEPLTRDEEEIKKSVKDFLDPIFASIGTNPEIQITIDRPERNINVVLVGEKMGLIIGKRGQTLSSLQHLLNIVINTGDVEKARVIVDTENYKEKRRETLEHLAKSIASKVKRNKTDVSLEPMNSYERRIIHETLANDSSIETLSCGSGMNRFVVIKYKNF
jgi:spoIIIJ-associated protein